MSQTYHSASQNSGVGGGGAGVASSPPKVLICRKSGQNSWKIWAKSLKIRKKIAPNVVWLQKMAPTVCKKSHEDFFGVTSQLFLRWHTKTRPSCSMLEKICGQSCT